ncbi:MAG: HAD family hydrolase, partial [Spirochaetales bacterium]|nr:HAD family hydrolase [Candidatus Physcosoma equi]
GENLLMKLVVFDLDGTLLNTIEDIRYAVNYALSAFDMDLVPSDRMMAMVGSGLRNALSQAVVASGKQVDEENSGLMMELLMATYLKHPADLTYAYEGIPELLKALLEKGIQIGILSNKKDEIIQKIVDLKFPDVPFAFALGQTDKYPLKPRPDSLYAMMELCGVNKKDVVYVGDSEVDAVTARNAGVPYYIVSYGFRTEEQLKKAGVEEPLPSVEALREALGV